MHDYLMSLSYQDSGVVAVFLMTAISLYVLIEYMSKEPRQTRYEICEELLQDEDGLQHSLDARIRSMHDHRVFGERQKVLLKDGTHAEVVSVYYITLEVRRLDNDEHIRIYKCYVREVEE